MISVISGVFVAGILGGVRALYTSIKTQHAEEKAHVKAVNNRIDALYSCQLAFGHDRIYAECLRHLHNGYITTADLDNMMYLMTGYENVGGDNTAHLLWEKVKQLPQDDSKEPSSIRGTYPSNIKAEIKAFKEGK